jgi:TM2 domain-containing membrane protein YozV
MSNRNEEPGSRSNDWSTDPESGPPSDGQNAVRGDTPKMVEPTTDQPLARHPTSRTKLDNSDIFKIILSAIFPGVGQMMLGQQTKGIVVLMVAIVTGCGFGLVSLASALDTYCVAITTRKRQVDEWEFFPDIGELF